MIAEPNKNQGNPLQGVGFAVSAYLTWGLSPIYFKLLKHVAPSEILMHRMVWSLVLLLPLVVFAGQWREFIGAIRNRRTLVILTLTTVLVASNWFIFIWAINSDHILQTSLGYYINPLVNVLLGMLFLRERLRPLQALAVAIAAVGVLYLTVQYGKFPWVALILALTFGTYGLIRKVTPVGALAGLTTELLILFVPAGVCLTYLYAHGRGAFLNVDTSTDFMLAGCALVTGVPLLLFILATKRLHLSTIGFLQYIAPSCTFLLAVFVYNEPLVGAQMTAFVLIWTALGIFSFDSFRQFRRTNGSRQTHIH